MATSFKGRTILGAAGLAAVVLVSAAIAGRAQLLTARSTGPAAGERAAQPVQVTRVIFSLPQATQTFTGTVRPHQETVMSFRLSGKIVARPVEVGDAVAAGQLLAKIDDGDVRLSLEAAEAEVTASRTDLSRAAAESHRSRKLFDSGYLAKAGLDKAISANAEAQARLDRALRGRDQAANALSYTTLLADHPGVVTSVTAEAGQVVAAGQAVAAVASTSSLDVVFALPEQMRPALEGARATALLWDDPGHSYALTLRDISPDVDPAARTYRVRMSLAATDSAVTLGRTMTVTLTAPAEAPVAVLPLAAVMNDGEGAFVWRLRPHDTWVQRVAVEIASLDGGHAQLRAGLADGDLVISLGAHKIDPGRPVRVVQTTSASAM